MSSCCFTGGRPTRFPWKYDENDPDCRRLKQSISEEVARLADGGCTHFISGMAQGADTYCAEAVLLLRAQREGITLECALPCPQQTDGWTQAQKTRHADIVAAADKVTMVSDAYTRNCMLKRNAYMVDHADVVLAVWNGTACGGTYNTIAYARKNDKTLKIIRY